MKKLLLLALIILLIVIGGLAVKGIISLSLPPLKKIIRIDTFWNHYFMHKTCSTEIIINNNT